MNDHELLQDYLHNGSQGAFAQLVERHVDLVYSTAHRLVRDRHLAEDVTQQVFILLARKAGRLGSDTILSAWLYRAARHVASETVRRESRRRRREQLAVEAMNQSEPNDAWRQIERVLDEAMADLGAADHDAVVLRYFEDLSLKEVGAALGSSEDAAQKRVARALERLRTSLARRGLTVSGTVLAAAVTSGAVQSAPAGLAPAVASASLAAGAGSSFSSSFFQVMATSNLKVIAIGAVVVALSVSVALLLNQNASLHRELAVVRASALEAARSLATNSAASGPKLSSEELRRLRLEHLEVLSLRGRVTQLGNELRQRRGAGAQGNASPDAALEEQEADSILLSASLTNRVTSGHTLVAGGWSKDGMRAYLLATPVIQQSEPTPDGRQIIFQSQIVGAPESFWDQIGWGSYKSDTRRSTLAGVLTPDQLDSLLQAIKETADAGTSNASLITNRDEMPLELGWQLRPEGPLMGISGYARITPDGQAVDLELRPLPAPPNIDSSLRPVAGPASSQPGKPAKP
jgi:RNA polymerase sigma factor (sigma-70 family)